jgi:hypothetical protein
MHFGKNWTGIIIPFAKKAGGGLAAGMDLLFSGRREVGKSWKG